MEIVKYPDPRLLTPSVEAEIGKETRALAEEMFAFMANLQWGKPVGLAAPQVGHNVRVFWALDGLYINPKIIERSGAVRQGKEGCYSLEDDKYDYMVKRNGEIVLEWQDKKGGWHKQRFGGFKAIVIQHEFDHLEGKLCNGE